MTEQPLERIYPTVRSKWDFVKRYKAGEFGNASPTWNSAAECLKSNYRGLVHIRNTQIGGATFYNVKVEDLEAKMKEVTALGYNAIDLYISAMAPSERTTMQGEIMRGATGPRLYYNKQPVPMRTGFETERLYAGGVTSTELMRHYMNPKSYDWLQVLFDRYPGHVIEFSCYEVEWGTLPGYNTCFWEVRSY